MFDLIVIGAGPGGYEAAIRAAQNGLQVALCEKDLVGGTCLNRGCIPTKALLHAAELKEASASAAGWGIGTGEATVDYAAVQSKKDEVVAKLRGGIETLLAQNKITLLRGAAQIVAKGRVLVNEETHETKNILIATGAAPARPPIAGLNLPGVMTSDELLFDQAVYPRLVILGGGVIGLEMATAFQALGSQVTIIEMQERILPLADREISQSLAMQLKKKGVAILTGARLSAIEAGEPLVCKVEGKEDIPCDAVLVAVGRKPNTEGLFADGFTLDMERGRIWTDVHHQTSVPGVYAIGDVACPVQLAHVASAQGIACAAHISGQESHQDLSVIPSCVYTTPEAAWVGICEQEAKEQGIAVKTGKFLMTANGRTLIAGGDRAFIKAVFDAKTDVLLGAQLLCEHATDMIDEFALALANGMTREQMLKNMRPHPSFAEGILEMLESVEGNAIHMTPKRR